MKIEEKFHILNQWYNENPIRTKEERAELRTQLEMSVQNFNALFNRVRTENRVDNIQAVQDKIAMQLYDAPAKRRMPPAQRDILKQPKKMKADILLRLYQKVMESGDHNAAFRIAQIQNWITEQKEIRVGLTADEIARRNLEAEQRVSDFRSGAGHRVESVPEGLPLLSDKIREDKGQG